MPDINETLPDLADRDMDINETLPSAQEQLMKRSWDNKTTVPFTPGTIINPGQGQQSSGDSSISSWFHNSGGDSGQRYNPFSFENTHIPDIDVSDADRERFDTIYPYRSDNEDIAAMKQGVGQKLLFGTAKGGTSLVKSAADMVGLVADVGAMMTGGSFTDNAYNKFWHDWKTSVDKSFPIYESQAQRESWLPNANTLPKALDVLGMIGGMALGGGILGGAAKLARIGKLAELGSQLLVEGPYWSQVSKIAQLSEKIAATGVEGTEYTKPILDAINEAAIKGTPEAISKIGTTIKDSKAALDANYAVAQNVYNTTVQGISHMVLNLGIASAMGNETKANFIKSKYDEIRAQGREPADWEIAKIEQYATDAANTTALITGAMGAITLTGFMNSVVGKNVLKNAGKEKLAQIAAERAGKTGVVTDAEFIELGSEGINYVNKPKVTFTPTATTAIGKFGQTVLDKTKRVGKYAWDNFDIPAGLTMAEFGVAGSSVDNYYNKKYDNPNASILMDGVLPNLKGLLSPEGLSTVIMGALGATLTERTIGAGHRNAEKLQNEQFTADLLTRMNDRTRRTEFLNSLKGSMNRMGAINDEIINARTVGDVKAANDKTEEAFQNYIYPRIAAGMKTVVDAELDTFKKLSANDTGLQQLRDKGYIRPDGDDVVVRREFNDYIDRLKQKVANSENYYNAIKAQTGLNPAFKSEHVEKLLYLSGMTDDAAYRIGLLNNELNGSKLKDALPDNKEGHSAIRILQELMPKLSLSKPAMDLEQINRGLKEINEQISKLPITDTEKTDISKKLNDMTDLAIDRYHYLKEYKEILIDPRAYNAPVNKERVEVPVESVGKKLDPIPTLNKTPIDFEIGKEYYSGTTIKPGVDAQTGETSKFLEFQKFKVIGDKIVDEKRNIIVEDEKGNQHSVPVSIFSKYKIGAVETLNKPENRNARYWFNNRNSVFELNMGPKGKKRGRLHYDTDTDTFSFIYKDTDGKVKETEVTKDQFRGKTYTDKKGGVVSREPRIRKVGEITAQDKEFIEAKETEKEQKENERRLNGKLEVIEKLVTDKKSTLKRVEDTILDHEIKLEKLKDRLDNIKKEIEQSKEISPNKKRESFKKGLQTLIGTSETLGRTIRDLEYDHNALQQQASDLQYEIENLEDIAHSTGELPIGHQLLDFLDENRKNIENLILDTGEKINTLSKFINKARVALKNIINNVLDYIDTFELLYPDFPHSNDKALREFISKENEFSRDQNVPGYFETNPDVFIDLKSLKSIIANAEELDIPLRERDIDNAQKEIESLYTGLTDLGKQLKINNELYDAFYNRMQEYKREQRKAEILNSPEWRQKLQSLQGNINSVYEGTEPVITVKKEYAPASKSITNVHLSSVQLPETVPDNDFFQKRTNQFVRNANLDFSNVVKEPGQKYVSDDPDYRTKMNVIVVTKQNQHHYFGENKLIADNYSFNGETVDNSGTSKGTVAFVNTYDDGKQDWFVDQNGKLLTPVNSKAADPKQVIYQLMETADIKPRTKGGEEKFHRPADMTDQEFDQYVQRAKVERAKIVNNAEPSRFYKYNESLGIANYEFTNEGERAPLENSVAFANIIPNDKIAAGTIIVPTKKTGNKVQVGNHLVPGSSGRPMVVYNGNIAYIDGKRLGKGGEHEVNLLYSIIKAAAVSRETDKLDKNGATVFGAIDNKYTDHLRRVLFFSSKTDKETGISNNQIYFDNGSIAFKLNGELKHVFFVSSDIDTNQEVLKEWLGQAIHSISKNDLSHPFNEITNVNYDNKGKLIEPTTRKWNSYEQYLLSETTPDGQKRESIPMTVNIKGGPEEVPFKNKYIVPEFGGDYFKPINFEKPVEVVTKQVPKPDTKTIEYKGNAVKLDESTNRYELPNKTVLEYKAKVVGDKVEVEIDTINGKKLTPDIVGEEDAKNKKLYEETLSKKLTEAYEGQKETIITPKVEVKPELIVETKSVEIKEPTVDKGQNLLESLTEMKRPKVVDEALLEVSPLDIIGKTDSVEEVKNKIETVIPQIKFEELPEFIKTGRGTMAYGQYNDYIIKLYNGAPEGTGDHEIYHAVEDSFLNNREILDIRKEFKNRGGEYVDRFGEKIDYSNATEQQVREKLAEEFREFSKKNPDYTPGTKIGNFFKRLYNFIKHIILGNPTQVQGIFKRINSGYYRDSKFIERPLSEPDYSEMKGFTEMEKKNVLHGFYNRIIDSLEKSNGGLIRLADGKITQEQLFESLFDSMNDYYSDPRDKPEVRSNIWNKYLNTRYSINERTDLTADQKERAIEQIGNETLGAYRTWEKIMANEKAVKDDMLSYMKKYKLVFKKDIKPEELENESKVDREESNDYESRFNDEVGTTDEDRDHGYESNILTYDAKDNAALAVKLLFSNLVRTNEPPSSNNNARFGREQLIQPSSKLTSFLLPELVSSSDYMNKVLDEMSGITSPEAIQEKLFDMAKQDPVLVKLYNSVYKEVKNEDDWRLRVAFTQFAQKVRPEAYYMDIDKNGRTVIKNANTDSDANSIITNWQSDLRGDSDGLSVIENDTYKLDTSKLPDPRGTSDVNKIKNTKIFLEKLHFPIENVDKLSSRDKSELVNQSLELYSYLKKGDRLKEISTKALDTKSIKEISKLLAKSSPISKSTSRLTMDGTRSMNHILPNTLTRMFSDINSVPHIDQLPGRYLNDTWIKNSQLLKRGGQIFDESGSKRKNATILNMSIIDGVNSSITTGKPKIGMGSVNAAVRFMTNLNMNLEGVFSNFIAADSQTEAATKIKNYITPTDLKNGDHYKEFNKIAHGYLEDEIDLIKQNITGERDLTSGAIENDNYKKLQVFKDVLDKQLVDKITNYANKSGELSTKDFVKSIQKEVNESLKKHFDLLTDTHRQFLEDSLILEKKNDGYRFNSLNTEFLDSIGLKGNKRLTEEQVNDILTYRSMNVFAQLTEMRKLFYGPWYEVPDAPKRDKTSQSGTVSTYSGDEEFNRWHNQNQMSGNQPVLSGDFGYSTYRDSFKQLTFAEPKSQSKIYNQLKELIGDNADPYGSIDEMDAQGIVVDTKWKEYKLRSGDRWSSDDEKQHQYDLSVARKAYYEHSGTDYRKELKEADEVIIAAGNPHIKDTGNPLKPLGSGMQSNDMQSMPYLDKTSIFRLTYPIAKGRGLEDLYWFMHDNDIAIVGPKSFQKFGRTYQEQFKTTDGLIPFYGKDGKILSATPEQVQNAIQEIPWSTFNKIVETSKTGEGTTRGTQLLSLATVNTQASGLPLDFWNPESDDLQLKQEQWNQLSDKQKREQSNLYRLQQDNNKAIVERSVRGYEDTLKDLGITDHGDSYSFTDPIKLVDYLKSEILRRDLPDNVAMGLQWDIDSQGNEYLKNPLEIMGNYQELNNLIWSLGTKNILKPKMNGTSNILVSSTGFEKKGVVRMTTKNGKSVLASSELKYYEKGKDGNKTSLVQVYTPNHLIKGLKRGGSKLTDEELFKYLKTKEGKELLQAVGFRIPTQGLNSIDAIEIVPWDAENNQYFLPAEMGNSVIVPSELVTKVGLDFDVDKMPTYHYNFYVDKDGYPRKIEFIENTNNDKSLERLYKSKYSRAQREEISSGKLMSDITDIKGVEEDIPTLEQFIAANKGEDPWKLNSKEAIENKYIDTLKELITLPGNYEQLVTPNSSDELIGIFKDISNKLGKNKENRNKKDINYSKLLDPLYLSNERQDYRDATGKSIGIVAQNNTFHAISQLKYIPIDAKGLEKVTNKEQKEWLGDFKIHLDHTKVKYGGEMKTVLSGYKNAAGNLISDFISQLINGAVDAVKDKWMIELLQNKDLLSTATFLGRVGVHPKSVFYFINQPAIQEFVRLESINRDVRLLNPNLERKYAKDIYQQIIKIIDNGKPEKFNAKSNDFTETEMGKVLTSIGEGKKLGTLPAEQKLLQKQILQEYIKYRVMSEHMLQEQLGVLTGNMQRLNDTSIQMKNRRVEHAKNTSSVGAMKQLEGGTYNSDILELANKFRDAKNSITPISGDNTLDKIRDIFTNPKMMIGEAIREKVINKATLAFIDYATQIKTGINRDLKSTLLDGTSAAQVLGKERTQLKGDLRDVVNGILYNLRSSIPTDGKGVKTIDLTSRPLTGVESDILTEALRTLRDNPATNNLYKEIVNASYLQSGMQNTRGGYRKYLPNEDVMDFMRPVIDKLLTEGVENFNETAAFYRNSWNDTDIVPIAQKSTDFTGEKYWSSASTPKLNELRDKLSNDLSKNQLEFPKFMFRNELYNAKDLNYDVIQYPAGEGKIVLLQKVYGSDGKPLETHQDKDGNRVFIYKQINAWGDGPKMQEYYEQGLPSVNPKHSRVFELSDHYVEKLIKDKMTIGDVKKLENELSSKKFDKSDIDKLVNSGTAKRDC